MTMPMGGRNCLDAKVTSKLDLFDRLLASSFFAVGWRLRRIVVFDFI
jgi:hypothetical protein